MPRVCSICTHDSREAINRELVEGVPSRNIAERYGTSVASLHRHKAEHLPGKLVKAREALDVAEADDLLGQVRDIHARTLAILEAVEATGEHRIALAAIREARSNLELLAKLIGELDESPTINVLIAPRVQQVIVQALEAYPSARRAVAEALAELEESVA